MRAYWTVFVPLVDAHVDVESPIGTIRFAAGPEVCVLAPDRGLAQALVEEFVDVVAEGPHAIRCLGIADENSDGSRAYSLAAKGFLCLPKYEQPVLRVSAQEVQRIRSAMSEPTRFTQPGRQTATMAEEAE
jgi:hypothetical protein